MDSLKFEIRNPKSEISPDTQHLDKIGVRNKRPWGAWTVLEAGPGYKVKRLEVLPGKRLSLQKHFHRSEHWVVVQGRARVTNGDRVFLLGTNQWTFIPVETVHRVENPDAGALVMIEVQSGNDLRETDIVRLEDDFGRPLTYEELHA